jgi:hypothetical protein
MDELERSVKHLRSLTFPSVPEDDGLATVIEKMSELEGQLLRLAARTARMEAVTPEEVPVVRGVVNRLAEIDKLPEEDAEIYAATVEYLEALVSLHNALVQTR